MDKTQNFKQVLLTKQTKNLAVLVIGIILVVILNAGLPLIQGQIGYTVEPVEMTYGEYLALKEEDHFVRLTFNSDLKLKEYRRIYIELNPDLTPEEIVDIEIPDTLKVTVYTKFFWVSAGWWISSFIGVLSTYIVFITVFMYVNQSRKETDKRFIEETKKINEMNERFIDPDTFEPYMKDVFNRERKIKQHLSNVKYELSVLEKKTPFAIREKYMPYFELPDVDFEERLPSTYVLPKLKWYNFKEKRYLNKKKKLLSLLKEDYVQEYVEDSHVKYFKEIRPGFVYSGVNKVGRTIDEYSNVQTDKERKTKDSLKKIMSSAGISVGFATMFTVAGFTSEEGAIFWYIINVVTKMAPLVISWLLALDYNNTFFEEQIYPNLKYRYNIGLSYLAYEKKRSELDAQRTVE